jgi:hypothetical protein
MATAATTTQTMSRKPKGEGSIQDIFTSLGNGASSALPPRFAQLKQDLWNDSLYQSWSELLAELQGATAKVATKGREVSCANVPVSLVSISFGV